MEETRIRKPDTGLVRPYRPKPHDFREVYIRIGWSEIVDHYQTNWRCARRWIDEEGRESLKQARAEHVRTERIKRTNEGRYYIGKRLTAAHAARRGE
jgi:hypothetical protein